MSNIEERLRGAKQRAQEAQTKKIQLDTRLESVMAKKQELLDKCRQLNISPDDLEAKIQELTKQIDQSLAELETVIPTQRPADDDDMPF